MIAIILVIVFYVISKYNVRRYKRELNQKLANLSARKQEIIHMESHIDIKRRTLENEFAYQDKCLREREDTLLKGLNSVKEVAESIEDSKVAAKINGTICSETEYLERAVKRRRKLLSLTYHQHN